MDDDRQETTGGFRGQWDFLSNMHETPCEYAGRIFPSSEHLYQWLKIPDTPAAKWWKDRIFDAPHGKVAKKLAANPNCPCKSKKSGEEWEQFRLNAMEIALRSKFKNPEMRRRLAESSEVALVEHNVWGDVFWGVSRGMGRNLLGGMLMRLRAEFQNECSPKKEGLAGAAQKP